MGKRVFTIIFGALMIAAGINHFVTAPMYTAFFGTSSLGLPIVYASGIVEIAVGAATLAPQTRAWGTLGILVLMVCFTPLHVIDVFAERAAIGSHTAALIRLPIQFVLIAWAFVIYRNSRSQSAPRVLNRRDAAS
jgi:uncharacterized membrane protein